MNIGTLQIINLKEFMNGLIEFVNLFKLYAKRVCLLDVNLYGEECS